MIHITVTTMPALKNLIECAIAIEETHGTDVASNWIEQALEGNIDLFVCVTSSERPSLRLIRGGAV